MKTSQLPNSTSQPFLWRAFLYIPLLLVCFDLTSAATITVTNNNDSGPGSLREAISDSSAGRAIDFDSSLNGQTITLNGDLLIDKNLTIAGPGANLLVLDANQSGRVFLINAAIEATISGLTIVNGFGDFGGGILNNGSLTITNSTIVGNRASVGGGIANAGGPLTGSNCTRGRNSLLGVGAIFGGGIYNSGLLMITDSTLSGNSGANCGGGIYHGNGSLTVTNSTFNGNLANAGGGGIYVELGNSLRITITNSTLTNNSADLGGGIANFNFGDGLTIASSTLNGNSANFGGGIYHGN